MKNGKKRANNFSASNQPPNDSKKVKKRKTVLKEAIGLDSFESVQEYILTKGAKKFTESIHALTGRNFVNSYLLALEYFKPKLNRTEHKLPPGTDVGIHITRTVISKAV